MSDTQSRVSPIVAIAAVSVILFSAVGVGVMTGVIPSSFSQSAGERAAAEAAKAAAPARSAQSAPAPRRAAGEPARLAAAEPVKPAPRICAECGTVSAVNVVEQQGEGTGLGAVAGGVVGGVLGNQIGHGTGRKVATVAGAAGGAYAGHQAEKYLKTTRRWDVAVRLENGASRTFSYEQEPAFRVGDKVRVVDGRLAVN